MLRHLLFHPVTLAWLAHAAIVIAIAVRVIMKRPATGVALAWLVLTAAIPSFGAVAYLLIGERRIGGGRARRIEMLRMFGSVNLDLRSFWLDYEVAMFVYQGEFSRELRALQQAYMDDSDRVEREAWARRSFAHRFLENSLRLASPLL
jgi:hypothetical protein